MDVSAPAPTSETNFEADDTMVTALEGASSPQKTLVSEPLRAQESSSSLEVEEHLTGRSSSASPVFTRRPLPVRMAPADTKGKARESLVADETVRASSSSWQEAFENGKEAGGDDSEDEEEDADPAAPRPSVAYLDDDDDASDDSPSDLDLDSDASSSSSSDSDSSSSSSSTLRNLLAKVRTKYAEAEAAKLKGRETVAREEAFADGDDVVRFDESEDEGEGSEDEDKAGMDGQEAIIIAGSDKRPRKKATDSEMTLKRLSRPLTLGPLPALTSHSRPPRKGVASTSDSPVQEAREPSKAKDSRRSKSLPRDRFGLPPPSAPLSKSQLKSLKSRPTRPSSKLAFHDLPIVSTTPEIKREVQALRLHNSLDPKRFYRGGGRGDGMKDPVPERFRFGYVVGSGMGARVSEKGPKSEGAVKKRSFLEAMVEDEAAKAYAKKKFVGEIQKKGASGGKNYYKNVQKQRQRR